jgi:hypothetical protein
VAAAFDDAALVHHDDAIGVDDGGEPVRDDQCGAALRDALELGLDRALGACVERRRDLVEYT